MSNQTVTIWEQAIKSSYTKFSNIDKERAITELGYAYQILQGSTALQNCNRDSIENAIINVARTSVTLNPVMKLAYLVPRKGKCVLDFSYMGMIAMLRDYGCVRDIKAYVVYEDDEFNHDIHNNVIIHKPYYAKTEQEHNQRQVYGCYTRAVLPNGDIAYEFMPNWEIEKIKNSSSGSNHKDSAWNTWKDEMYKKSVVRRHFKTLLSMGNNIANDKVSTVLAVENENNPLENDFSKKIDNKQNLSNAFIEEAPKVEVPKEKTITDLLADEIKAESEPKPIKEQKEVVKEQSNLKTEPTKVAVKEPIKEQKEVVKEQSNIDDHKVKIKPEVNGIKANEVVDDNTGEVIEFSDEEMDELQFDFDDVEDVDFEE